MHFNYYVALFAAFCGPVLSQNKTLASVTHPTKGQTIQAGSIQQIKWQLSSSENGPVQILLQNKDSDDYTEFVEMLSADHKSGAGQFRWKVNSDLPPSDKYYIRVSSVNDIANNKDSGIFKIKASNATLARSSSARMSSATNFATGAAAASSRPTVASTISGSSSTPSSTGTSTSAGGGSMATSFASTPLALVGAVAVGMLAL